MTGRTPSWLSEFQARFGSLLQRPLDRSSGTLQAPTGSYERELSSLVTARNQAEAFERLAVYHRQYWFRLFTVLQRAYPLTTRLLGHWAFNRFASSFLLAHPPVHWDLDRATTGLAAFLAELPEHEFASGASTIERLALVEAAQHDQAYHGVFSAPEVTRFRLGPDDQQLLANGRLVPSRAAALVEEHWPLISLRRSLPGDGSEAAVPVPARLKHPQYWLVFRARLRVSELELEPQQARLFTLLRECSLSDALGKLETECAAHERAELPGNVQRWLARSMELDMWCGFEGYSAST